MEAKQEIRGGAFDDLYHCTTYKMCHGDLSLFPWKFQLSRAITGRRSDAILFFLLLNIQKPFKELGPSYDCSSCLTTSWWHRTPNLCLDVLQQCMMLQFIKNGVFWVVTPCVALVRTDVSEDRSASIIRVTIGELGTLAVTINRNTLRSSSETSVLTTATHGVTSQKTPFSFVTFNP
jgi:hypothetical protein